MTYITLGYWDIALASLLILINAGLSIRFNLGLERPLLIAATRTVVQLFLIGLVLKALFQLSSPLWTGLAAFVMITMAGREVMARQDRRFSGFWSYGIGTSAMLVAGAVVTVFALTSVIKPEPWYEPRFALPLLGMVLGNVMTGIALGLNTLTHAAWRERAMIEARLALGHTRAQAFETVSRDALKTGMMPIINSMAIAGVVSLPGMMTGQILAGADPVEAVKYQILIMFLIAGGVGVGTLAAVMGGAVRLSDGRHRLRLDRLVGRD